jgi:phosphoglucomutase
MPGVDGLRKMAALMAGLRGNPPEEIAGQTVVQRRDYMPGTEYNTATGESSDMTPLKNSDVLSYLMNDGTLLIIRPSGTEPKVKVYLMVKGDSVKACDAILDKYTQYAEKLATQ